MDLISRAWLKEAIHNFFNGLTHEVTEEDIQRYIDVAPSAFEGMTNGEVLKAIFPNMKVHEYTEKVVLNGLGDEFQIQSMAWKNWWNAPYKGVSE